MFQKSVNGVKNVLSRFLSDIQASDKKKAGQSDRMSKPRNGTCGHIKFR